MKFHPALGDPEGLHERERSFFSSEDFLPLPSPGPHDWRSVHQEPDQSFPDWLASDPPRPRSPRRKIYLQPVGSLEREGPARAVLQRFSDAFFAVETQLLPPLVGANVSERRNPATGQRQLLAPDLIDALAETLPDDAFCLVGLTMIDLYPRPSWNYVFGQASVKRRVGVYSFWHYASDDEHLFLKRCLRVMAHEIGHLFGIAHCTYFRCLMNGSNHLEESDARPLHLCPVDLRKLAVSVGFDVAERYGQLASTLDDLGLDEDAEWFRRRLGVDGKPSASSPH